MTRARHELNQENRKQYYSQVQKIIAQQVPYVSLWHENNIAAMRKNVFGYTLTPDALFSGLLTVTLKGEWS
ncbi:hypothetical protein ACFL27_15925 [candidate division CSSED10-310 bacterium]|uniref:Solute-binding protein family 5 domain-containing protein n=1 Tax=candidate division CSSED10-310 bacterium TaxID=2855610 RepID=A0ABV6YZQ0_UNCC1